MMIDFRDLKYSEILNCSFAPMNGGKLVDCATFQLGDHISLIFDVTEKQFESVNNDLDRAAGLQAYMGTHILDAPRPEIRTS